MHYRKTKLERKQAIILIDEKAELTGTKENRATDNNELLKTIRRIDLNGRRLVDFDCS